MEKVSIIIPARNEIYLQSTIQSILSAAEGEIEVITILDGYWPDPPIQDDPRVTLIHHTESIGQRAAVNEGVRMASGKYIMKTDGHSMFDKGFDTKLKADCEYDWTVIPRMYNLDAEKWEPKWDKKTDFMYIRSPHIEDRPLRAFYLSDVETAREYPDEYKAYKEASWRQGDICDVMTGQGACFFMHKDRFWELGGMDENHGSWGQMGVEVALKAWLSGGSLKVNKKTWFAHMFRTSGKQIPYKMSGTDQQKARDYSIGFWTQGKWPLQKRPLSWLVDKFAPVPTWNGAGRKAEIVSNIAKPIRQTCYIKGYPFSVEKLFNNLELFWDVKRQSRAGDFIEKAIPFFKEVHEGKTFTDDELIIHPYFQYIKDGWGNKDATERFLQIMREGIALYHDIKENGMKYPVEMWIEDDKLNISRGSRRIVILHLLGKKYLAVRVFKTKDCLNRLLPPSDYPTDDSINGIAMQHFMKWGWKATDKYWIHDYTSRYDRHFSELRITAKKVLEIGVKRGASLALWRDVFPNADIYGIDIDTSQARLIKGMDRITLFQGSQDDIGFLKDEVVEHGKFDVIVDDGSHLVEHQIVSFKTLWDSISSGGYYVIEDLGFHNYYGKEKEGNTISVLKGLVDDVNNAFDVKSLHFYHNICFIQKR